MGKHNRTEDLQAKADAFDKQYADSQARAAGKPVPPLPPTDNRGGTVKIESDGSAKREK